MDKLVTTACYRDTGLLLYKCLGVRLYKIKNLSNSMESYSEGILEIKKQLTTKQIATDLRMHSNDLFVYNLYEQQGTPKDNVGL